MPIDLEEAISDAGRYETVSVERAKLTADMLRDMVRAQPEIGFITINNLIELFEEEGL